MKKQVSKRLCAAGHDCSGSKDIQWFKWLISFYNEKGSSSEKSPN